MRIHKYILLLLSASTKLKVSKQAYAVFKASKKGFNGTYTMTQQEIKKIIDSHRNDLPVKVGAIAEELKISIISTGDLPANNSGSLVKETDDSYTIYVDKDDSPSRRRFTVAHELGHFAEHKHLESLNDTNELLSPRKTIFTRPSQATTVEIEKEADTFAAELLMPVKEFKIAFEKAETLTELAEGFGVSRMAANVRAVILGLGVFR